MITTKQILEEILIREGWPTYTSPSAEYPDRGGHTKGGITLATLKAWRAPRPVAIRELKKLEKDEALEILHRRYVECNGIQRLEQSGLLFAQVIDNAVLSGPYVSACDLQRALGVVVDGMIGPQTCAAVEAQAKTIGHALVAERALRLVAFTVKHPKQLIFLKGWMRRVLSFL
jgi:lysozyme family protein